MRVFSVTVAVSVCLSSLLSSAGVAAAEDYAGRGYFITCGDEGCFVNSAGYDLFVPPEGNAWMLEALDFMTAVEVEGTLSDIGDSSAVLSLTGVTPLVDDLYEGNLRAMQGDWRPVGEENPFVIGIYGMDWSEVLMDEVADRFMMSVGDACADGTVHAGMVINLYRYGDDPGADACWQMEYIDDSTMTLRDLSGDFGAVDFARVSN
ncbi:MAG: hypothetical protein RIR62_2529 [Pseudomonadota bacterium]